MAYEYNFADFLSEALGKTGEYILDQNTMKKKETRQQMLDQLDWWYRNKQVGMEQERLGIARSAEARAAGKQPDVETDWKKLITGGVVRNDIQSIGQGVESKRLQDILDPDKTDEMSTDKLTAQYLRQHPELIPEYVRGKMGGEDNKPLTTQQQMGYYNQTKMNQVNDIMGRAAIYGIKTPQQLEVFANQPDTPPELQTLRDKYKAINDPQHMRAWFAGDSGSVYFPPLAGRFTLGPVQQATGMPEQGGNPTLLQTGTLRAGGQPTLSQGKSIEEQLRSMSDEELKKLAGY